MQRAIRLQRVNSIHHKIRNNLKHLPHVELDDELFWNVLDEVNLFRVNRPLVDTKGSFRKSYKIDRLGASEDFA